MGDLRVPDLNVVYIAGRLAADPELKYLPSGTAVCDLRVANTRYFKDRDGQRAEETCFVNVTLWAKQAEFIGEKLRKGRPVLVEGRLKQETWDDKNTGQKRSKLKIHGVRVNPLDWDDDRGGPPPQRQQQQPASSPQPRPIEEPIPEDDIPF